MRKTKNAICVHWCVDAHFVRSNSVRHPRIQKQTLANVLKCTLSVSLLHTTTYTYMLTQMDLMLLRKHTQTVVMNSREMIPGLLLMHKEKLA